MIEKKSIFLLLWPSETIGQSQDYLNRTRPLKMTSSGLPTRTYLWPSEKSRARDCVRNPVRVVVALTLHIADKSGPFTWNIIWRPSVYQTTSSYFASLLKKFTWNFNYSFECVRLHTSWLLVSQFPNRIACEWWIFF